MLCEHCKMREATVRYVEVINGVKSEHNLCPQCASRVDFGQYSSLFEREFPLGKLLSGLLGIEDTEQTARRYAGVVCPTCKTTYEEFVKDSKFGCQDCYGVFDPLIGENIRHLQGSEKHVGKRPRNLEKTGQESAESVRDGETHVPEASVEERIRLLQSRLSEAIRREEYEEAAALRDQIHQLKEEAGHE